MSRASKHADQPRSDEATKIPATPDLTIVCCIEFGRLEEQTILMIRSLRTFGGAFADVPVMAVIGRIGPPLREATRDELSRLGARIVRANRSSNPASWLNYANKVAAVVTADELAETDQIAWFDSDMFVLKEPREILLSPEQDLAGQCHPWPPAVVEGDNSNVSYWEQVCDRLGVEFSNMPWTRASEKSPRQKLNFTSGMFTWRRGSGFAQQYAESVRKLLRARIAQSNGEFFTIDQVVIAPLIVRNGLRWKPLSIADHSIVLGSFLQTDGPEVPPFAEARVLHYSNSFAPAFRPLMEARLKREVPAFWKWLQEQELRLGNSQPSKMLALLLRTVRGLKYRAYARSTLRAA